MHGIINLGRSYANGTSVRDTSCRQDRRIVQEIFRELASHVEGVDAETLLEALRDGLAEDGITEDPMANLLRFFDGVEAKLTSEPATPRAARFEFKVGDKVRCPSELAQGEHYPNIEGVGEVRETVGGQGSILVYWPNDFWYHWASELELVSRPEPVVEVEPEPVVEFHEGDRVRCPSGLALGSYEYEGEVQGIGTVVVGKDDDGDVLVRWSEQALYHRASELELVEAESDEAYRERRFAEMGVLDCCGCDVCVAGRELVANELAERHESEPEPAKDPYEDFLAELDRFLADAERDEEDEARKGEFVGVLTGLETLPGFDAPTLDGPTDDELAAELTELVALLELVETLELLETVSVLSRLA